MNPIEALPLRTHRLEICMYMHENVFDFTDQANQDVAVHNFILEKHNILIKDINKAAAKNFKTAVHTFVQYLIKIYKASNRHIDKLVKEPSIQKDLPNSLIKSIESLQTARAPYVRKTEKKLFLEKSTRGQYLEAQKLRENVEPEVIHLAAKQNLTKTGKKDARFVLEKSSSETGLTAAKAREAITSKVPLKLDKMTSACALGFLLNQNLTRAQYDAIRSISKEKGADIWPSYKEIQNA
jgi:hypothetical protein